MLQVLENELNGTKKEERLKALKEIKKLLDNGFIEKPQTQGFTNNHVHTTYSFSPYSPANVIWTAYKSGLSTVGIMDHDAILGAEEFIEAGKIIGIATTIGFEIRSDWSATKLAGKKINNPDQITSAYIAAHGLPHNQIMFADDYLSNVRKARYKRNEKMVARLNNITEKFDILLDFNKDILPLSLWQEGGEITERHLLFGLVKKLTGKFGKGQVLVDFVTNKLNMQLNQNQKEYLLNEANQYYEYDLLNVLKGNFVKQIYIDAGLDETPPVKELVDFIKRSGAIATYCYLGDVGNSVTGDKSAQKFEDDFLNELFEICKDIGFQAIAFMPSRNTQEQLKNVMELCKKFGFMQISGEDINQPRQSFICRQLQKPEYNHLTDSAWALVGHEYMAGKESKGMFAIEREKADIEQLICEYKIIGKESIMK